MNHFVAQLLRKEAGGDGKYYRQLKRAYYALSWIEKTAYVQKAKAMVALYQQFKHE